LASGVCAAYGASVTCEYLFGYPLLINDNEMTGVAAQAVAETLGADNVVMLERPLMGGEDFAYFLEKVPGAFIFLGTGSERFSHPLHHPLFDFNEAILPDGAKLLASLVKAVQL
jgi:metal-dependent amidase/aminoacylase/carboxypeptidase family protein